MGYQKPLYLTTKRDVFYYTRRVPQSLKAQFQSPRFVKCLHTKSETKAAALSTELSSRLENIWDRMRLELLDFKSSSPRIEGFGSIGKPEGCNFLISDGFGKASNPVWGHHKFNNLAYNALNPLLLWVPYGFQNITV